MLSHAEIWNGIDLLAKKLGLSPSALARRAGLDPTAFNPSKRFTNLKKERWLSTETLSKVLEVTKTSLVEFAQLIREKPLIKPYLMDDVFADISLKEKKDMEDDFFRNMHKYITAKSKITDQRILEECKPDCFYIIKPSKNSKNKTVPEKSDLLVSVFSPIESGHVILLKRKTHQSHLILRVHNITSSKLETVGLDDGLETSVFLLNEIEWMVRIIWIRPAFEP